MTTSRFPEAEGRQALSVRQINAIIRELIDGADRRLDDEHADRQLIAEDLIAELHNLSIRIAGQCANG